ncbi:hypothetical protein EVAR_76302_1 [Eumeta japonica]|uniref:Secreted protein n=1 Tax=Eumeta variegata TaxID=151549 RepID=A0A4C1UQ79_EUMVA|nr:hypothetical protein EVAR_76302_1 [Eumeta japonica]
MPRITAFSLLLLEAYVWTLKSTRYLRVQSADIWRKLAPLRKKMGGGSLGLGGAVGGTRPGAVLAVTACVEAETGFRVDSAGAVLVV